MIICRSVRNNPLKYIDPDGEDTVEKKKEYSFEIEKKGRDRKGRPRNIKVKVTVVEKRSVRRDDKGKIQQRSPVISVEATAQSTGNVAVSQNDLNTISKVTETIIMTSQKENVSKETMLAIGARETMLGSDHTGDQAQYPSTRATVNPMRITAGSETTKPSNDSMEVNVLFAILHYKYEMSRHSSEVEALQAYGPGIGRAGGTGYGRDVQDKANGIKAQIQSSIRTTSGFRRWTP